MVEELNLLDQPTPEEVMEKAEELQIDDLILAKESLTREMDPEWKPYCNRQGNVYYINLIEQMAYIDHPVDMHFKTLYAKNNDLPVPTFKGFRIEEVATSLDLIAAQTRNFRVLPQSAQLKVVYEEPSEEEAMSEKIKSSASYQYQDEILESSTSVPELSAA
jgi:hypothetical protein